MCVERLWASTMNKSTMVVVHFISNNSREVVNEILKRLLIKCLLLLRCVCKEWCSLISSPDFITQQLSHTSSTLSRTLLRISLLLVFLLSPSTIFPQLRWCKEIDSKEEEERVDQENALDQHNARLHYVRSIVALSLISHEPDLWPFCPQTGQVTERYKSIPDFKKNKNMEDQENLFHSSKSW